MKVASALEELVDVSVADIMDAAPWCTLILLHTFSWDLINTSLRYDLQNCSVGSAS